MPYPRPEHVHVLISPEERAMAESLAAKRGTTVSEVVRSLVRREHDRAATTPIETP